MKTVRLRIHGRVQGVGFRDWVMRSFATRFAGWVRNRSDGTVELVLEGAPADVDKAIEMCRKGPPLARVTDVRIADEPEVVFKSFELRPTE